MDFKANDARALTMSAQATLPNLMTDIEGQIRNAAAEGNSSTTVYLTDLQAKHMDAAAAQVRRNGFSVEYGRSVGESARIVIRW